MSNFVVIEEEELLALQVSFIEDMNQMETLDTNIYPMAFESDAGTIFGFQLTPDDYDAIITSNSSMTQWKVKFGYTDQEDIASLKLVLYGLNDDESERTENFLLTGAYYEAKQLGCANNSVIGHHTGCTWLHNYMSQAEAQEISKSVFTTMVTIDDQEGPALLRGYSYPAADFRGPVEELDELHEFFIGFAIHTDEENVEQFGLLMVAKGIKDDEVKYSHFYDAGATCPPIC